MATIKDIATKSGYSPATVSRVLNNDSNLSVTASTRNKIMQVASELEYWQTHKKQRKNNFTVGFLYQVSGKEQLEDAYFASLKSRIVEAAKSENINLIRVESVDELIDKASKLQGFIAVDEERMDHAQLLKLSHVLPSGVFIDSNPMPGVFDSVKPNLVLTVRDAVKRMLEAGYKSIGFIGANKPDYDQTSPEDVRATVFKEEMSLHPEVAASVLVDGVFSVENGYKLGKQMLQSSLPQGLIIASDTLSVGVLQAFNEKKVSIPGDTQILSINNLGIANYVSPPLSSYNVDQETLSNMGLMLLKDAIINPARPKVEMNVNTNLVIRKSFI
ncbi:LacI family transcriptional regulator [Lactobacillus colini]|uniref:LacI family transcriptional regulator n=1 Tax=Lactobacillus colini TaxID=1819254 RepID=A0ABS4MFB9_9LACO|nr:LacI family DNA-binding transcriptional regulator [Lactobacillus colini]MBP2058386.1 LacI family transcriptional regulator [Lactobacillus colini]